MTTVSDGKEIGNSFKKYFSYILFLIAECYIFFIFSLFPFFYGGIFAIKPIVNCKLEFYHHWGSQIIL